MPTTEQSQERPSILQRFRAAAKAFGDTRFGQFLNEEKNPLLLTAAIVGINAAAPWGAGAFGTGLAVCAVNFIITCVQIPVSRPCAFPFPFILALVGGGVAVVSGMASAKNAPPILSPALLSGLPELGQTESIDRSQNFFLRMGLGLDPKMKQTVTVVGKDAFFVASNNGINKSLMVFKLNGQNYVATLSAEETFTCSNNTLFVKGTSVSEKGHIIKDKAALLDFSLPSSSPAYPTQITVGGITLQEAQPSACEMAKQSLRTRAKGQVPTL